MQRITPYSITEAIRHAHAVGRPIDIERFIRHSYRQGRPHTSRQVHQALAELVSTGHATLTTHGYALTAEAHR